MAVALITGAGGALGGAVARRLASAGHVVALNDRLGRGIDGLAAELGGVAAAAEVSDPDAVREMVEHVERRTGEQIGILVANAACSPLAPLAEQDLDDWWRTVDADLGGAFACAQAVMPGMVERGGGRMVLVSSEWGVIGRPDATAHSASKAGIIALTKSLGRELAPLGIAVNAVAPSVLGTAETADESGEARARVPLGRLAEPAEVAAAVAFLADDRLPTLVGQILHVNGGTTRTRA
ncbi:SDR family NAD(P)-dependent oxidoreductase [Actinomadura sp. NTSP31]|uniref:SDR family NAD(P)-dependent oxidoreductase n=1 Tax=Actinomadura sp. NTSP31 TaxID=1735447 RepID=UPI0035BFC67A